MPEGSLEEGVVQKRVSRCILSSPPSSVDREMLQCVCHWVCSLWREASSHVLSQDDPPEHVRVGQPGPVTKPAFLRKGTCCFVTSTCGSSSRASRRVVRSAAGENRSTGSSVKETPGIVKILPRDAKSQLLPCLARGEPMLPHVRGLAELGVQQGGPGWALWAEGLSQPLSGCPSPRAFLCRFRVPNGFSLAWFREVPS